MKKFKKLIFISVAGTMLLSVAITFKSCSNRGALEVSTEIVSRRSITETVSANGKIQPEVEVKISPDVSGEVVALMVKEGDPVKVGDLLLKINPDIYASALDRMEASLNTSRANLANSRARLAQVKAQYVNAEASFKRNKQLHEQGAISPAEFDAANASFESAKADVEAAEQTVRASEFNIKSAEASLKEARDNLNRTTIFAPIDGIIYDLRVEKGERVVGTSQMAGTQLLSVANLNAMEVQVDVNENDIVRVALGDTALIEVEAYLDRKFKGIVTEIANSAKTEGLSADQVTNFEVKIRILSSSYEDLLKGKNADQSPFRPGMSATVDIRTTSASNVLTVPIQAVTTRTDTVSEKKEKRKWNKKEETDTEEEEERLSVQDEKNAMVKEEPEIMECVFVYNNGKALIRFVKSGIQDNKYIEIKSGLEEGDEIIIAPYSAVSKILRNNSSVEKVDAEDLFGKKD